MTEFKIGRWVSVLGNGSQYRGYVDFFEKNDLLRFKDRFKEGELLKKGDVCQVVAAGKHEMSCYSTVYVLEKPNGDIYLMSAANGSGVYLEPIPEFKVGDKVVPHSKSFGWRLDDSINWTKARDAGQPFLYVTGTESDKGSDEVLVLCCHVCLAGQGDYFLPSDLTLYVEPAEEEVKPDSVQTAFKVGGRVRFISGLSVGMTGTLYEKPNDGSRFWGVLCDRKLIETSDMWDERYPDKKGMGWYKHESGMELLPPVINDRPAHYAPENKSYRDEDGDLHIVNGPVCVCIIEFEGRKFKGIARCAPGDVFDEERGTELAWTRANIEFFKWSEKMLSHGEAV